MYSLLELSVFILYFIAQTIKVSLLLLAIQIIVYRLTGFSIYKFLRRNIYKLITVDF